MKAWVLIALVCSPLFARETFKTVFEDRYFDHYEEGHCGKNSLSLVLAAHEAGLDAGSLTVVSIENKGFSAFGMVNAERARDKIRGEWEERELNWYHHVFVMDDDGRVYDSDFSVKPRPIFIEDYIETMFLDEKECTKPVYGEFCVGRKDKLNEYEFASTSGNDVVANKETPKEKKARMGKVLKDWRILLH